MRCISIECCSINRCRPPDAIRHLSVPWAWRGLEVRVLRLGNGTGSIVLQLVFLQTVLQSAQADSQMLGGQGPVAPVHGQGLFDGLPFYVPPQQGPALF